MQEGAHTLRRERFCVLERCRAPQNGETPLHLAAINGRVAVVETLLKAEAATDATDKVREKGG